MVTDEPQAEPRPLWLDEPCTICNAKPGEGCASLVDASKYRETPHAQRELARKGSE